MEFDMGFMAERDHEYFSYRRNYYVLIYEELKIVERQFERRLNKERKSVYENTSKGGKKSKRPPNSEKINQAKQIFKTAEFLKKPQRILRFLWELRGSNPRPSACKADALNQLS